MKYSVLIAILYIGVLSSTAAFTDMGIENKTVQTERNFYLENWIPKYFVTPGLTNNKDLPTGNASIKIEITNDSIAPILPTILGLNTTFRSGSDMVKKRVPLYKKSNMGIFRFPAGSGSNLYFWDGNIPSEFLIEIDNTIDATKSGNLQIEEFADFINQLGAQATVNVNYFYARYGKTPSGNREDRVKQAADYAAGFVRKFNVELKAGIKNWEIGNECYGKWEEGYDVNGSIVTGKEYGEDLRVFAEAMKAVDPTIKIGAVMYPKDDNWNDQVMTEVKDHADFLIVHNYFTTEKDATIANILNSTSQIGEIKLQMENCIERNTSFPKDHYPVAMTEYNCRGPQTTTMLNACFTAEVLGEMIKYGYGMATRWVGEWKWKVGTHGLFAVEDPDMNDYEPRQAYMVYRYLGEFFGDKMISSSSTDDELKVYASQFSSGERALMVINSTGLDKRFNLNLNSLLDAHYFEVYANSFNEGDKKYFINGESGATKGGGPEDFENIVPYKTTLSSQSIFSVRPYSVTFIVLSGSNQSSVINSELNGRGIKVYPNPVKRNLNIESDYPVSRARLYNLYGECLETYTSVVGPLSVSHLPQGVYVLNLLFKNNQQSVTFLKF